MSLNTDIEARELKPSARITLAVRIATAAISLTLVALAWYDDPFQGAAQGYSWYQITLFLLGIAAAGFCFTPFSWNARALTLLVSVSLTLVAAEFVLRPVLGPQYYGIYQLDERVLYRLIPGAKRMHTLPPVNDRLRIHYEINSQGFRGNELALPGQSLRVVVYGDSFIQGDFSRTDDTFTERLKAYLARRMEKEVEVVNAGVAGYGPDQEFRRMEDELHILKPDLAIVAIYAGNDFGDLVRDKLYNLSNDGTLIENRSVVLDKSFSRDMERAHNEPILRKIFRNARHRLLGSSGQNFTAGRESRRARVESDLIQGVSEYRQYVVEGDNVVHELYMDPYNADVSLMPQSASARYKIAMMAQLISRMRLTASAHHVPLLFVLIPTPIDVTDEHETGEVDPVRYPAYRKSTLTDILEDICQRNNIPAVNLFQPFWEHRANGLFLKGGDDHWNKRGQDFAAELVSNFVTAQGLLRGQINGAR